MAKNEKEKDEKAKGYEVNSEDVILLDLFAYTFHVIAETLDKVALCEFVPGVFSQCVSQTVRSTSLKPLMPQRCDCRAQRSP